MNGVNITVSSVKTFVVDVAVFIVPLAVLKVNTIKLVSRLIF
jgi:hypothetical protein